MRLRFFTKKVIALITILLMLVIALLLYYFFSPAKLYRKQLLEETSLPPVGSRLLIVAPHCDDETLGPGILLSRALKSGRQVKVVIVTNGDGFTLAVDEDFFTLHPSSQEYREFGYQRQKESISALKELGVKESDIYFLGYPDTGIAHLWTEFWDKDKRFFSRYTQTDVSPYKDSFDKYAPYTGENLLADLDRIMREYKPTHIYYPHPNDRHPDHWGVNAFIKYLLEEKQLRNVKEILYLVHRGNWPVPKMPRPNLRLYPPVKLTGLETQWLEFPFVRGEADLKKSAILKYRTQVRAMKEFLLAFVRSSELFGVYPDYRILRQNRQVREGSAENMAIADATGDVVTRNIDRAADLRGIYSYVSGDKLIFELASALPVTKSVIYRLHGRLFYENDPAKRFDMVLYKGGVSLKSYAHNSITNIPGLEMDQVSGRWRVKIPLRAIRNPRSVFLNADSGVGRFTVDKTAWRMLRLKDAANK